MLEITHSPHPSVPWLHVSPRMHFQLYYANQTPHRAEDKITRHPDNIEWPNILNVGCSDDPLGFGPAALHVDMDDWSQAHEFFQQGDAHALPLSESTFHTVILGDILEHCIDPWKALREAARVASRLVVATVFEEWRFGKHGYHPELGQRLSDQDSQELGYKDREDAQLKMHPVRIGVDDTESPHLCHLWQFNAEHLDRMCNVLEECGMEVKFFKKVYETQHESGHDIYNWLISAERHYE